MADLLPSRIALSGPIGAGKTELRKYLVDTHGYTPLSFAYPLRLDIADYFGIPIEWLLESPKKEEFRWLLVLWGTDMARRFDQNWWVKRFREVYAQSLGSGEKLVLDDLRFKNEYDALQDLGFDIVRLQPSFQRTWEYLTGIRGYTDAEARAMLNHDSETALADVEWKNVVWTVNSAQESIDGLFDLYRRKRGLAA